MGHPCMGISYESWVTSADGTGPSHTLGLPPRSCLNRPPTAAVGGIRHQEPGPVRQGRGAARWKRRSQGPGRWECRIQGPGRWKSRVQGWSSVSFVERKLQDDFSIKGREGGRRPSCINHHSGSAPHASFPRSSLHFIPPSLMHTHTHHWTHCPTQHNLHGTAKSSLHTE